MVLKAIVKDINDVDEKYRDLYTQKGDQYELTAIEGVRTQGDVDRLQTALKKERDDHKAVKDRLALLGDRKIEDVVATLDRLPELEAAAAGKIDDNKLNEIVETRIKSRVAPIERENSRLKTDLAERDTKIQGYEGKEKTRLIHDSVREAISKNTGFQPSAVEDALVFAERMLEINEDGRVVTRDGVGVTPGIDSTVWLTEMQSKKAHWWGPSMGGGSQGGKSSHGVKNPWTHGDWNMTEQGRIYKESPDRAHQLAKSAGTTVGGTRPDKK